MKKLLILFSVLALQGTSQTKTKTLKHFSGKNSTTHFEADFGQFIDMNKGDTTHYVSFDFQNAKYDHITDLVVITITKKSEWEELLNDLVAATQSWNKGELITWDKNAYTLFVPEKRKAVFFQEAPKKGSGYVILYSKDIERLLDWSKTFTFPG